MDKRLKTHPSQWAVFLDFAETNPQILTKKFDGQTARKKYNVLWEEISNTLNSMGYIKKTVEKWQKAIADWKSKVKSKAADLNKGFTKTGGGGPLPELTENERRLIAILGTSFITGIKSNVELGFAQTQEVSQPKLDFSDNAISVSSPVTFRISPPPLTYTRPNIITTTTDIDSLHSTLQQTDIAQQEEEKKEIKSTPKKRLLRRTTGTTQQRIPSKNLTQMHEDTLQVLKQINNNIEKMAHSQERLAEAIERLITMKLTH